MFDAKHLLDQLVGSGAAGGFAGGLAGGALAYVLSGKKARKVAASALQLGGMTHAESQWHYPMDQQWSTDNAFMRIHIRHRDTA